MRWLVAVACTAFAVSGCTSAPTSTSSEAGSRTGAIGSALSAPRAGKPVVPSATRLRAGSSQPVEDPYYPQTSNPEVDVLHYFLDLAWDGTTLRGVTTISARAAETTNRVRLDLSSALHVSQVVLDGRPLHYRQAGNGLLMDTGRLQRNTAYTLRITYAGTPQATPAPSRRADLAEGLGWVVDPDGSVHTFQEPYGAFTWYPVNDHPSDKALYDARITTKPGTVGIFNGTLVARHTTPERTVTRWHLDQPAASYLTTIAIGPYTDHVATTPSGMRISYWIEPRDRRLLSDLQREGSRAYEWLVAHAGPYPFSTLGVVVVGGTSAMETQTLMTLSRAAARRPDAVIEHEMSHQWYGDSVTPTDWQGLWLNEGWAMYMQQWYEADTGRAQYDGGMSQWRQYDMVSRRRSGPPGNYDPGSFADTNVYLGPAMMLDRIRQRVGTREFYRLVRQWPAEHANGSVDRAEFRTWLERKTGKGFSRLLHRWLDSQRTPR